MCKTRLRNSVELKTLCIKIVNKNCLLDQKHTIKYFYYIALTIKHREVLQYCHYFKKMCTLETLLTVSPVTKSIYKQKVSFIPNAFAFT